MAIILFFLALSYGLTDVAMYIQREVWNFQFV